MSDESREQPIEEPVDALNKANEQSTVSEVGSQTLELGKFKSVEALLDAYNNLQSEFTKKCQMLSQIQKDKLDLIDENLKRNDNIIENQEEENEDQLNTFLSQNDEAKSFVDEIKTYINQNNVSPYQVAWANVVLSHLKDNDNKTNDPIINQYVLSDSNVKNKIIEDYIKNLQQSKPPITISSKSGERLSSVIPDSPKTLEEAKNITLGMFS